MVKHIPHGVTYANDGYSPSIQRISDIQPKFLMKFTYHARITVRAYHGIFIHAQSHTVRLNDGQWVFIGH
jgi:hypothetical protein